jgi:hypothetical protein
VPRIAAACSSMIVVTAVSEDHVACNACTPGSAVCWRVIGAKNERTSLKVSLPVGRPQLASRSADRGQQTACRDVSGSTHGSTVVLRASAERDPIMHGVSKVTHKCARLGNAYHPVTLSKAQTKCCSCESSCQVLSMLFAVIRLSLQPG